MKAFYSNQINTRTMINELQAAVYKFNKIGGQYCAEEHTKHALEAWPHIINQYKIIDEERGEAIDAAEVGNLIEFIDGIGDYLYTVLHLFNIVGLDANVVLREIQRSNMSKFVDGKAVKVDGKIQKGPDYFKPDWDAVLPEAAENYKRFVESYK